MARIKSTSTSSLHEDKQHASSVKRLPIMTSSHIELPKSDMQPLHVLGHYLRGNPGQTRSDSSISELTGLGIRRLRRSSTIHLYAWSAALTASSTSSLAPYWSAGSSQRALTLQAYSSSTAGLIRSAVEDLPGLKMLNKLGIIAYVFSPKLPGNAHGIQALCKVRK